MTVLFAIQRRNIDVKRLKTVTMIMLFALLPITPFLFKGYAGHDVLYHVTSWLEVRDAWQSGRIFPTWSAKANFTLGDPRFCFYPPVSLIVGGLSTSLLPDLLSPAAFEWLCFLIAGLAMHFACKPFVAEEDRLRAAVLYMLGPYFIMTSLVRFAAAELLVQAWLPLIVLWLYRALRQRDHGAVLKLGCLLGLSWLTDVPAAIMLLYGLLPVAAICAWRQHSASPLLRFFLAELLGGAIAAFYLAPVWAERHWISIGELLSDDPRLSLMFMRQHGMAQPNYVLASWLFAIAGTAMVAACLWTSKHQLRNWPAAQTWGYLAAVAFVFQLPLAGMLWRYLPELAAVQFPFRFLALTGVALPLVLFARGTRPRLRWPICTLTAALSCIPVLAYARAQSSPKMRTPPLAVLESGWKRDGYMGKPEYVQPGVSRPTGPVHLAPAVVMEHGAESQCEMFLKDNRLVSRTLITEVHGHCDVRLGTYYFPYWRATDESGASLVTAKDARGLLVVALPSGKHTVTVLFHPTSPVRSGGALVSIVSVLFAAFGIVLCWKQDGRGSNAERTVARAPELIVPAG